MHRAAPAKINLALHVTGRRADGYHRLETLVVFAGPGDRLAVVDAARDAFAVSGRFAAAVPADGANLVVAARDRLREVLGPQHCPPVALTLDKNLPVAAGIGGGSSDAAATLAALAAHWRAPRRLDLGRLGLALGADLPMCLAGVPLLAGGIGEAVEPLAGVPALPMVLANPGVAVPTPAVFAALARRINPPLPRPAPGTPSGWIAWLAAQRNDLEAPARALAPAIGTVLAELAGHGAALARMSGSGATCFGLFETGAEADSVAVALAARHPDWWVLATQSLGSGERHGD